ncbi:MAG: NAD(P)/FAD-dependent oxidoreductase [Spirochaetales bacterium]|nr:NAD(P)/FAD-dependent oxidoreductase [Leptospiraceae bacterium]MCP5482649.1 NAD(P)/FAD-dependent oxidoreductase [Spirochaetales bacterium]MCP5485031.1 NAD(P)/FAD-dependent oxidoreductase [Spirochaetales bacterium]
MENTNREPAADNQYDIIIIGSGMGALATASLMARLRGKRVLVLERHYVFGGFTHEFRRKKFSWDVGIHYVGDMQEGGMLRRLFDIITRNGVSWKAMPDVFEKFVYPDFTFPVPSSEERYRAALIEKFPEERDAIENYFEDVKRVDAWFGRHNMKSARPFVDQVRQPCPITGFENPDITTGQYFEKNFRDEKLRALLESQWGDYGIPPSRSAFIIHCSVVRHYLGGGFYPDGGAGTIAESVRPIIEEAGGRVLLSHEVDEILVRDNRAIGVRVRNLTARKDQPVESEFYAPVIVSNAGAYATYCRLLSDQVHIPFRTELQKFYSDYPVTTSVTLYVGLKDDPRKLGFHGENHWIFASYDHDTAFSGDLTDTNTELRGAYLSFPSLKSSESRAHTAEIIALTSYEPFRKWEQSTWKRRGDEYETLKESISEKLRAFVDDRYPGFRDLIAFDELSTPLTVSYFTAHPRGSIYGVPSVRERFRSDLAPWCSAHTPIEGLYLTGADASSPGIAGALMGAMATVGQIPDGISFIRVLKEAAALEQAPSDKRKVAADLVGQKA